MSNLKETFAGNLREKRRKNGLTQERLAEKVGVSTHHIAMVELGRNFPTAELIERIAAALKIEIYELFLKKAISPGKELELLRAEIKDDIKQLFEEYKITITQSK